MKFSCDKDLLLKSIETVSKAILPNNPVDILKGMKIEVTDSIKLTGSDGNMSIESVFDANIEECGTLIVDSRIFYDIIRNIPDGKIKLYTTDNNEMKIVCENTLFNILYLSSEGYPEISKVEDGDHIRIYSKNFKEIIKNTLFAVSDDESKPIFTGICFEINKSNMKAIAIDRTRLALRNQIIPETNINDLKFVDITHKCSGGTATCMNKAICSTCSEEYGEFDLNNHASVSTKWFTKDGYHYHKCECGAELDKSACSGGTGCHRNGARHRKQTHSQSQRLHFWQSGTGRCDCAGPGPCPGRSP